MVTKDVISEIYRKYSAPPKNPAKLDAPRYLALLSPAHDLAIEGDEIVNRRAGEFEPFSRFLIRRLTAILEFDKVIAFAFKEHIIFFDKEGDGMHVHFKPEKRSFISRLFSRG